jgi:hypothetical protein
MGTMNASFPVGKVGAAATGDWRARFLGRSANLPGTPGVYEDESWNSKHGKEEEATMAEIKLALQEITLAKALKLKNRLAGRLAKVQADIQTYNSVPEGQAGQVDVPALVRTREELVGALVSLKTAVNEANREVQRDIYDLAEKKATTQFLAGVNTRHGPQPAVYPSTTEVHYVAALRKADVDALVARLEKEIDQLQDKLDRFNHEHTIEVDGRVLELAS